MGLLYYDAKLLWEARLRGVSFRQTLTLGHQVLFLHPAEVRALRRAYHAWFPSPAVEPLADYRFGEYADRFLRDFLAVAALESLDYSPYEGATIIHDLNQPVPEDLWGRFDAAIDGGSLEHVFNFPVAVANLMRMTRVGGSIFLSPPANNLCGHGLYQFSPDLMFRVFSPENGFELKRVVLLEAGFPAAELAPIRAAYEVADPASTPRRVGLLSRSPVLMLVEATKTADVPPFAAPPQQSYYVAAWDRAAPPPAGVVKRTLKRLADRLPVSLRNRLLGYYLRWRYSLSNRQYYHKL